MPAPPSAATSAPASSASPTSAVSIWTSHCCLVSKIWAAPLLRALQDLGRVKDGNGHLGAAHDVQEHVVALIGLVALGAQQVGLVDKGDVRAAARRRNIDNL